MGRRRVLVGITILLLAGAVLLLVVLPLVAAPMASERLSSALGVPIRIGRIEVSLLGPRLSAYGITLRTTDEDPVASVGAIHADLALGRLLEGSLALDSLTLEQPELTVRRTPTGDLNLAALLPPASEAPPDPTPETADTTPIDIATFRLHDGTVAFADETATPALSTTVRIDRAEADDLHLTLGGDANVALRVSSRIGDDAFKLELAYEARGADSNLTARLRTTAASLARVIVHARLDWEHVAGTVDAEVAYERTVAGGELTAHRVTVDASATDLALADSAADEATFRAETTTLSDLVVDLSAQRVDLGTISAENFWALAYQDETGLHVPFASPSPEEEAPVSAWQTDLRTVTLGTGTLALRNLPPGSPDLPVAVRSGRIAAEEDAVHFTFDTAVGGGTLGIDGHARTDATRVSLAIDGLDVPGVTAHLGMPIAFASGKLGGALDGVFADGPARFSGRLVATDVKSAPSAAHPEEVFAWATLEVELAETTVAPPRIHATNATLSWPYLMLHRRPDGLYPFTGVSTAAAPTDAPAAPAPTPPGAGAPAADAAADGPLLVLDRLTVANGRIEFYDTVLEEAYGADMLDLSGTVQGLRAAPVTIDRFDLEGSIDELSPIRARGGIDARGLDSELGVDGLRLVPLSRYIEPAINYQVRAGSASIATELKHRNDRVTADNDIELSRLKLRSSGSDPFKGELGVALPVALSLMKDSRGNIELDLPVKVDLATQKYDVGTSIVAAVRRAVLGTLQSPVRLLGAVLLGDDGEKFDLKPVPFAAGSTALSSDGASRVAQLARLLERHPALDLVLLPRTSAADALADAERTAPEAGDPKALAAARAATIQRTLQETYGIAPERVRARRPEADPGEGGTPGIDIQLRSR